MGMTVSGRPGEWGGLCGTTALADCTHPRYNALLDLAGGR